MTGPGLTAPPLICQVCGTENPATRQFCRKCASDLRAPIVAPGSTSGPTPEPRPVGPIIVGGTLVLLMVLLIGGVIIWLSTGAAPSPSPSPSATPTAVPSPSPSPTAEPTVPTVSAEPTPAPTPEPEPTPAPTPRPPRIRSFILPDSVPCEDPSHSGFVHASWEVRNATGVTISIDGPGIYKRYEGLTGDDDLPFSCSGPHTYLLTTVGGVGPAATRELTVEPAFADPSPTGS